MNRTLVNLPCKLVQCDEIWSFVGAKDKNVPEEKKDRFGMGGVWTWLAIDANSKLIVNKERYCPWPQPQYGHRLRIPQLCLSGR